MQYYSIGWGIVDYFDCLNTHPLSIAVAQCQLWPLLQELLSKMSKQYSWQDSEEMRDTKNSTGKERLLCWMTPIQAYLQVSHS